MTGAERTTIETANDPLPAYLAPADPGLEGRPAVIVVQEYWGLVPHIEDVCRRLAAEGFTAVAPDLYRGRLAEEPDEARKLSMELDRDRAAEDLRAEVGWLLDRGASSVGAVGFCMGGGLVWTLAHTEDRLGAAVAFYGLSEVRGLRRRAPLLAHYGTADRFPPQQIEELRAQLGSDELPGEVVAYEGAPHAFFNDTRDDAYRAGPARAAWESTLTFLREHLG
jgi:carboxymethylenebutenolidase